MKSVGIKELKSRLSEYLRDARHGTRVLVTDRNVVVAEAVRRAPDDAAVVVTSRLTLVEANRGLLRAEQEGRVTAAERHVLTGLLAAVSAGCYRLALSEAVCERAERPFPAEPVTTLDARHLASALAALEIQPEMAVLGFDERVLTNVRGLGLSLVASAL